MMEEDMYKIRGRKKNMSRKRRHWKENKSEQEKR
jgi:hypothetical protein